MPQPHADPQREPFAHLNRKAKWKARLLGLRHALSRPFQPQRIEPDRSGPSNLLVIGIDTLRADHLSCYGYGKPTSANLDRMATGGTLFHDVTAPAPWTLPSFSSALTGQMPGLHGAYLAGPTRNMDTQPPRRLNEDTLTLARHLRQQGYRTAAFYSNQFFAFGLAESFDHHCYHNLPAGELLKIAQRWIARHADQPFFCFVLVNDPHEPTTPENEDLAPFIPEMKAANIPCDPATLSAYARWGEEGFTTLGRTAPGLDGSGQIRQAQAVKLAIYDATIHFVDRCIGQMQSQLEAWDLARSTLVSVFSDHGEEFLDHTDFSRQWDHDPRGLHGIGHGHTLFQELLHVPWLSWGPGVPGGIRSREPVSLCDFAPTICHWLQVEPLPLEAPAGDFAQHLVGRTQAEPSRPKDDEQTERLVLSEAIAFGPDLVALRQGRWKLIAHRDGQVLALFDLLGSPEEMIDLAAANPDIVQRFLEHLNQWLQSGHGAGGSKDGQDQDAQNWDDMEDTVRQRLKDLGYSD